VLNKRKKFYTEYDDGKNVLRKAMTEFIPKQIIKRQKQGFSAPDESWYRGENAQYVKELLMSKNAAYKDFINPKFVSSILDEHNNKKVNHRLLIWSFMNFELWCQMFLEGRVLS